MTSADGQIQLSIIVVAYRQREPLMECLRSCTQAAAAIVGRVETIVVDNGQLASLAHDCMPDAIVIEPGRNLGFAGGVARALVEARGQWVALVNDDARIEPDALALMLQAGERDARIGSVAAQVRFESDPARVNSAGIVLDTLGVAAERLAGCPVGEAGEPGEVFGSSGCFALYRSEMLKQIGGIDGGFFAYLEDVDIAWRARAAGWSCVYEPRAIAYHRGSASSGEGSRRKYELVGRNRVRLLARNATVGQLLRAFPGIVLYDLAYVSYVALTYRTLAPLHGRVAGLRAWRSVRRETDRSRRYVKLGRARDGWRAALRQHAAYMRFAARD